MDVYLSREAESFGTILRGSVTRHFLIFPGLYYLSNSSDWQLFIETCDFNLPIFALVPTPEHCMKILPYSCHNLGFLLQDLESFKARATMGSSHEENAPCMFKDVLSMSVGTTPRLQQCLSYVKSSPRAGKIYPYILTDNSAHAVRNEC